MIMRPDHSARHYGIDTDRMLDKALGLPDQMAEAWGLADGLAECMPAGARTLVICGMGGSAIGGQLLRDLIAADSKVSVHIERGYTLPAFAGKNTPVVCISYSGNTEEVLSCFRDGLKKGVPMAVISSGGILTDEAKKAGIPAIRVPGGMPPRAALGYLFTPLLKLAACWGFCSIEEEEFRSVLRKTRKLLDKCSLEADLAGNTPMQLAKSLYGKIPLIYSANGLLVRRGVQVEVPVQREQQEHGLRQQFPRAGAQRDHGLGQPREDTAGDIPRYAHRRRRPPEGRQADGRDLSRCSSR